MSSHPTADAIREHALGLLDEAGSAEVEAHLSTGCPRCAAEWKGCSDVLAAVAASTATPALEDAVRRRILAAARPPEPVETIRPGVLLVHPAGLPWIDCGIPGIQARVLSQDKERGYRTSLIKMAPGAVLPPHRHAMHEEVFMLEGDFWVEGREFGAGDYCRSEAGTVHTAGTTKRGCTFLAVACIKDEILPAEQPAR